MSILLLVGILWGLSALVRASKQAAADRKRMEAERKRQAEAARFKALQWEQAKQRQAEERRRQSEIRAEKERYAAIVWEQERQRQEQERLAKEQERQAKEQARQAEQLAKHEEQLAQLEFRMSQAEADIAAESERIASLYALMDIAAAEQAAAVPGSKTDIRAQKQIISYQSAIHAAEKRKAKAEFTKQTAQQKLSA